MLQKNPVPSGCEPRPPAPGEPRAKVLVFLDKVFLKPYQPGAPLRGVELFNLRLLQGLADAGFALRVVSTSSWRAPVEQAAGTAEVEFLHPTERAPPFLRAWQGARMACRSHPEILLVGNAGNSLLPALNVFRRRGAGVRKVVIAHRDPSRRFARACASDRTVVLAVNQIIADSFHQGGCRDVTVDYGIMDADRFAPRPPLGERSPASADEPVRFAVLGALDQPWKGADTALRAFALLPPGLRRRCHLHLCSYSRPPTLNLPYATAHAWMAAGEIPPFLRRMDALIVPSRDEHIMRETFSQATVQGMLSGLPVLHSTLPVLCEKFDRGGGMAFDSDDELAAAITRLADDPALRREMGRVARQTALARYVWSTPRFVDRYLRR